MISAALTFFSSVRGVLARMAGSISLFFLFLSFLLEPSTVAGTEIGVATAAGVATVLRALGGLAGVTIGAGGSVTGDCCCQTGSRIMESAYVGLVAGRKVVLGLRVG